ncbi:MAG: hypothetical protein M1819_004009 [Sarea resinae]|nr:MAG: hypothetical protein M1819_004009 [Sarea resinae]
MTAPAGGQYHDRSALVVYGSETGNAQDVADEMGRLAERLHFVTRVCELDSIDLSVLSKHTLVIFVVSTTGQGDLPANARMFWRSLLRKKLPPTCLAGVDFSIFGLGDSSYPKFNWAARKINRRLLQLGAKEFYPRGEADEQHPEGIDGSFFPWSADFKKHLLGQYPLPNGVEPIPDDVLLQPKWTLHFDERAEAKGSIGGLSDSDQVPTPPPNLPPDDLLPIPKTVKATLVKAHRLTPSSHWQDVRHLTFNIPSELDYAPGDVLTIYPKNFPQDVNEILSLLGWTADADRPVQFVPTGLPTNLASYPPPPVSNLLSYPKLTLRSLLTNYIDITSIPRRSFFALIAHFTSNEMHKERLLEFTKPEFLDELYDYTTRPRRSIIEVLQEFESVNIPWAWAGTIFPVLRGRQFSIASGGPLKHHLSDDFTKVDLLVAIVKYRTVIKKIREGVCTRYIASLPTGTHLNVLLQKGGLSVTKAEARRPIVMVGPGTGVAPMRSLLWERLAWAEEMKQKQGGHDPEGSPSTSVALPPLIGENVLFFGCRNRASDFFYEKDWENLRAQIPLEVFTAFSRDQRQKIYVQDLVREHSALVYRLLHDLSGIIYICGSSGKMPQAVREALIEAFQKEAPRDGSGPVGDRDAAEAYLLTMEKEGRYKQETW